MATIAIETITIERLELSKHRWGGQIVEIKKSSDSVDMDYL